MRAASQGACPEEVKPDMSCDERSESQKGLGRWAIIAVLVSEGVRLEQRYQQMWLSMLKLMLRARRFAPRPASPVL